MKSSKDSLVYNKSLLNAKVLTAIMSIMIVTSAVGGIDISNVLSPVPVESSNIQLLAVAPKIVYKNQDGLVTANGISIRTGPGTNYRWQGSFNSGNKIAIVASQGSWYKVFYDGRAGYVNKQYVKITGNTVIYKLVYKNQKGVTKASTSVRTGSSTANSIQKTFAKGTNLVITASQGNWYKVSYSGKSGFVNKSTVSIVVPAVKPSTVAKGSHGSIVRYVWSLDAAGNKIPGTTAAFYADGYAKGPDGVWHSPSEF